MSNSIANKSKHKFDIFSIKIDENYINRCANYYLKLLRATRFDLDGNIKHLRDASNVGLSTDKIHKIINKFLVPERISSPKVSDIYRSDLGELLMTYYFESNLNKKYPAEDNFVIPFKNISDRESPNLPARGLDLIGYRFSSEDKICLLLGEAKVSEEKKSPPRIVDQKKDSIYKVHKKHMEDKIYLNQKILNIAKKLNSEEALPLFTIANYIEEKCFDKFDIVYGGCLLRDSSCHKKEDFGKLKKNAYEFEPNSIHFIIVCFDKSIQETVDNFYNKVIELNK